MSPSRATDFKTCPLLYRYRAIDRLPELPNRAAARGTLVHAVLEQLFTTPAAGRTELAAIDSIADVWDRLVRAEPSWAGVADPADPSWLAGASALVTAYFSMEDPSRFDPEACELPIEVTLFDDHGVETVPLRGYLDRLDVAGTGELRVVDYKTGRSPSEHREVGALYQLKFYALMIYRLRGVVPSELKLIYLADTSTLTYRPDLAELMAFQRGVVALWQAITAAVRTGEFPPHKGAACGWCVHQALCPEFGGTPPPLPSGTVDRIVAAIDEPGPGGRGQDGAMDARTGH